MMQPEGKPNRRRRTIGISTLLLVLILIIAYLVFGIGDDDDEPSNATQQANTLRDETTRYPVTIIILDDFSIPLKSMVDQLDERLDTRVAEDFKAAGDDIRALVREKGYEGPAVRGSITELVAPLKAQMAEVVMASPEMNLDGRSMEDTNCAVSPEGTAAFVTEGAAAFVTEGASAFVTEGATAFVTEGAAAFVTEGASLWDQPHGQRVQLELEELLRLPQAKGLDIQVRVLDADGFVFPVMAEKLDQLIKEIRTANPDMRIVVNMSFAIVPCEKVTDIVAYTRLLREFAVTEGDEESNDPVAFSQVLGAFYAEDIFHTPPAGEGTFQHEFCPGDEPSGFAACTDYPLDRSLSAEQTLYFVGASGNGIMDNGTLVGVDFPFYPAAWKEVIAVSASSGADHLGVARPPRAEYSNAGRIIMGGTWPPDPTSWQPQGILDRFPQAGTSFAAPRYSFIVALYLANAQGINVGCKDDVVPPPADSVDWLAAPPPSDKIDQDHCSTLQP